MCCYFSYNFICRYSERWDLPDWAEVREKYMGKRTMMVYEENVGTCLLVEGVGFEIIDSKT